jgi:hypothetical protein
MARAGNLASVQPVPSTPAPVSPSPPAPAQPSQTPGTDARRNSAWSLGELREMKRLRDLGYSWAQVTKRLPGRGSETGVHLAFYRYQGALADMDGPGDLRASAALKRIRKAKRAAVRESAWAADNASSTANASSADNDSATGNASSPINVDDDDETEEGGAIQAQSDDAEDEDSDNETHRAAKEEDDNAGTPSKKGKTPRGSRHCTA